MKFKTIFKKVKKDERTQTIGLFMIGYGLGINFVSQIIGLLIFLGGSFLLFIYDKRAERRSKRK